MTRSCEKLCGPKPGSKYTKKGKHRKEKKEDRDVVKKEVGVLVGGGGGELRCYCTMQLTIECEREVKK